MKVTVETAPDDELVRSCCRYRRISPVALSSAAPMKDSKDNCFDVDDVAAVLMMDSYNGVALYQETISTIDDDVADDNSETK